MGMLEVLNIKVSPASTAAGVYHEVGSPEITASLLDPCSSLAILSASSISIIPKPWKWSRNWVRLTYIIFLSEDLIRFGMSGLKLPGAGTCWGLDC